MARSEPATPRPSKRRLARMVAEPRRGGRQFPAPHPSGNRHMECQQRDRSPPRSALSETRARTGLSPTVILRCHGQVRAMFNWAVRKRMASGNPALGGGPSPREVAPARGSFYHRRPGRPECFEHLEYATFIQLAATVGARRGTLVALRWGDVDLGRAIVTLPRSIAQSEDGTVEKGTKLAPHVLGHSWSGHQGDACRARGSLKGSVPM